MKAKYSAYLTGLLPDLRKLKDLLRKEFDYVSILSTDTSGLTVAISRHSKNVSNTTMTTERGNVVRAYKDGLYSEYAFDRFEGSVEEKAQEIIKELNSQFSILKETGTKIYETPKLSEEPVEVFVDKETGSLPEDCDVKDLVKLLTEIHEEGLKESELVIDFMVRGQSSHISKLFLSDDRFLRQSYVYSEGFLAAVVARDGDNRMSYEGVSGIVGPELFEGLKGKASGVVKKAVELLDAERIEPGEYEVITTPEVSGLIAHEAFGHGVEMDMFVKGRALGAEYIGKRVGSDLVTMHEGALAAEDVASYVFDDEGTLAGDVIEIENGILKTGICDALSALRLGVKPTGNGKRENFEHKVYTRMTNTVFDAGNDNLEDMIASVKYGYLLEGMESGMEDPKHWGIQCIIQCGREIRDGKLTGKIVAPVIMTGYVPDLLGNISMASGDKEVFGTGGCGKGHKEWVKVSDGGPYLKTKARLG